MELDSVNVPWGANINLNNNRILCVYDDMIWCVYDDSATSHIVRQIRLISTLGLLGKESDLSRNSSSDISYPTSEISDSKKSPQWFAAFHLRGLWTFSLAPTRLLEAPEMLPDDDHHLPQQHHDDGHHHLPQQDHIIHLLLQVNSRMTGCGRKDGDHCWGRPSLPTQGGRAWIPID